MTNTKFEPSKTKKKGEDSFNVDVVSISWSKENRPLFAVRIGQRQQIKSKSKQRRAMAILGEIEKTHDQYIPHPSPAPFLLLDNHV